MFPDTADLLLKQRIVLYNNVAKVPNCECRLLAELEVYPTPRIIWELEVLGDEGQNFSHARISKLRPLEGIFFSIPEPVFTGYLGNVVGLVKTTPTGLAPKAFYKGEKDEANAFLFYLPNTRFQFISDNQCYLQNRGSGQGAEGKYIDASIDETWSIRLKILKDSLEWLEPRKRNIGTLITSVGELYQPKFKIEESQSISHLQAISLDCALERLKTLSWLLSYANGGYIQSLYVAGHQLAPDFPNQVPCAIALASQTTSLERLGTSWVVPNSDLKVYLGCLPVLERMMKDSYWQEAFDFIVAQYFQAVQPGIVAWQVRAIAVQAALERVSYTILVKDLKEERDEGEKRHNELLFKNNKGKDLENYETHWKIPKYSYKGSNGKDCYYSQAVIRLSLLLERVGLEESKDLNLIQSFVGVRNDAVHPTSRHDSMTKENREKSIHQATQWLDEVLLWRLGYYGAYLDRFKKVGFATEPRYDLKVRDPSW